jgi:CRISPR-associated protein Cmr4
MRQPHQLYLLHAVTPLHVGVEDSLGGVDLPTMKERHTGYPLVPGSSIKGVVRAEIEPSAAGQRMEFMAAFGPPSAEAGDYRGGLVFTDALLLALPVRSLCGTFAWVTCGQILRRLRRDLDAAGLAATLPAVAAPAKKIGLVPGVDGSGEGRPGLVPDSALLVEPGAQPQVFLEESILDVQADLDLAAVARAIAAACWPGDPEAQTFFRQRLLLVHDDLFSFLARLGLEVRARVRIDQERGTAADTGPWTEEHMPAETILYGLTMGRFTTYRERRQEEKRPAEGTAEEEPGATLEDDQGVRRSAAENLDFLDRLAAGLGLLRFGGHSTIGLGRAFFRLAPRNGAKGQAPAREGER